MSLEFGTPRQEGIFSDLNSKEITQSGEKKLGSLVLGINHDVKLCQRKSKKNKNIPDKLTQIGLTFSLNPREVIKSPINSKQPNSLDQANVNTKKC